MAYQPVYRLGSPTQEALHSEDILWTLFNGAADSLFTYQDLRKFALVCRAFQRPALRSLWRILPDALPLWHLFAPEGLAFPGTDSHERATFCDVVRFLIVFSRAWTLTVLYE